MVKGIIFDMDGTMVDNMMVHHRAWQKTLASNGIRMSLPEVKDKVHGINEELLERLFGDRFTPEQRRQISWEKEASYREIFLPELKLIAGLPAFLNQVRSANIPMAVGTAAPPENANFIIENLNLRSYFKGIFDSKSVKNGKPDPEIFEKAADSMGLDASDCLIFEDSVTGAEAAKRAGAPTVIVTTTHDQSEFDHYDHIIRYIDNFEGLDLDVLMDLNYKFSNGDK